MSTTPNLQTDAANILGDLREASLPPHPAQVHEFGDVSGWRKAGSYIEDDDYDDFETTSAVSDLTPVLIQRGLELAIYTCDQLEKASLDPSEAATLTPEQLAKLPRARAMIAKIAQAFGAYEAPKDSTALTTTQVSNSTNDLPEALADLAEGATPDIPSDRYAASTTCGHRTQKDGGPCGRLLKPDGKCPYHG